MLKIAALKRRIKQHLVDLYNAIVYFLIGVKIKLLNIVPTLKSWHRLYIKDQIEFFRTRDKNLKLSFRPFYMHSLNELPCLPISNEEEHGLCLHIDQQIITERQFAFSDSGYLAGKPGLVYKSSIWMFPQYSLYDVDIYECHGKMAYNHYNYYHDVVDFYFHAYLAKKAGKNLPILQMEMPRPYQRSLEQIMSRLELKALWYPSRLCRLQVKNYYCYKSSKVRIPEYPFNSDTPLFDSFRTYINAISDVVVRRESPYGRMIYTTRRQSRRVLDNNVELEEYFSNKGFDVVNFSNHSVEEQINIVRNAEVVVGLHGANLTNVAFMFSGTTVVEIMPSKKVKDDAYKRLSFIAGLNYCRVPLEGSGNIGNVELTGKNVMRVISSL
ncbi:MAG: hypothetical protein ACI8P9_004989 [Parasphingorhabdus sp.]|jgi:hypothetical protein